MPSTTPKQKRFMAAAANDPEFAKEAGISQKVAKEFHAADVDDTKAGKRRNAIRGAIKKAKGD